MDRQIGFKTRVRNALVSGASLYYSLFVCRDYLVLSDAFVRRPYYIISAEKDNFLHLTGVKTALSPTIFFEKCLNGSITEDDYDLTSNGQKDKATKGSIRRKIKALPMIGNLLLPGSTVEENFRKNTVYCSFASSDGGCTMGFIAVPKARPKTLLIGDELDKTKAAPLKIVLSKTRSESKFSSLDFGSVDDLIEAYGSIEKMLSDELLCRVGKIAEDAEAGREELPAPRAK